MNDSVQSYKWHWCPFSSGFGWYHLNANMFLKCTHFHSPLQALHWLYIIFLWYLPFFSGFNLSLLARPSITTTPAQLRGRTSVFHSDTMASHVIPCHHVCPKYSKDTRNYQAQPDVLYIKANPRWRWHNLRSWRWWRCVGGTWKVCQQGFNWIHNTFSNSSPSSIFAQFPALQSNSRSNWWFSLLFLASELLESPEVSKLLFDARGTLSDCPSWSIRISSFTLPRGREDSLHRRPFASTIFASTWAWKRRSQPPWWERVKRVEFYVETYDCDLEVSKR